MSATQKFFRYVFGGAGDRVAVPDTTPVDGSVAYEQGYGFDYQRAPADPLVKNIERNKYNQLLYDITLGLRQYQTQGFPEYIDPADNGGVAFEYDKNAIVRWTDGQNYVSLVDANDTDPSNTVKWQLAILGSGIGALQFFPTDAPPVGYVKANGALLNRAAYPALWAFAQASGNLSVSDGAWSSGQFSPGNGSTNFRIPDLRGYHLRGFDDGRGIDDGRVLGTVQADRFASHTHGVTDPGHAHGVTDPGHRHSYSDAGAFEGQPPEANASSATGGTSLTSNVTTGLTVNTATTGITTNAAGSGSETRVKNIALLACIKYL